MMAFPLYLLAASTTCQRLLIERGANLPKRRQYFTSDGQATNATRTVEDCFGLSTPRYYGQRRQNSNSNLTDLCCAVSAQGVAYDPHTTDDIRNGVWRE